MEYRNTRTIEDKMANSRRVKLNGIHLILSINLRSVVNECERVSLRLSADNPLTQQLVSRTKRSKL